MEPASDGGLFYVELTDLRLGITFAGVKSIAMDVQDRFDELVSDAAQGKVMTVTRDGKPVVDIVAHNGEASAKPKGFDWEAGQVYLRAREITDPIIFIADDFDDPLPEDFLLRPLP